ncbi:P-loop containing nucleoside triphosphate hydrolase protein [Paraphysoderma sedebokerense]|nr:P-loop containing nucleoside triphosphate hydrolase protein [Paraphysoderma sedebokerense]
MKSLPTKTQSFPWSHDVMRALRGIFKLKEFRENQLEAINATLGGKDCFVLMPTGGGKSLTYQLPSVISTGVTRGITIVITPLLSLMQDQIQSLLSKGIPALSLFGTQTSDQRKFAMRELNKDKPACKLLYVTPEMLNKSTMCQNTIARLHKSRFLARFVVDEAHCLSQWGHDFRPDYKELQHLKRQYPDIPIMALTATANDKVQTDIISILGIKNCVCFRQSFNRANLIYYVRPKSKSVVDDIYSFISTKHRNECGIIYCMSKKNCEDMCHTLQKKFKISCNYYHAGLSKSDREKIQSDWASGRFKIIVATVAFGMGIDKPDVRYVIHHSLPHSLENYYQETGRAGRDGNESECVMFYNFADKAKIESLIDKGDGSWAQKKLSKDNLRLVIAYCENKIECRRQQVLAYFGENFNPKECHQTCDNCMYRKEVEVKDVTSDAQNILSMVRDISRDKITLLYALDVWRGSKVSKIVQNGHDKLRYHGSGKNYTKTEAERIFHQLVIKELLAEYSEINGMGYSCSYLKVFQNFV